MRQMKPSWCLLPLTAWLGLAPPFDQPDSCDELYETLVVVPHVLLTRHSGPLESIWDRETIQGCEIAFETNDSIRNGAVVPTFLADRGTEMYRSGWRMIPEIGADGAGSGIHAIRRGRARCVVRREQAAYIDDDGTFVESGTLTMLIQCNALESTWAPPSSETGVA